MADRDDGPQGIAEPPPDVRPWYRVVFGSVGVREIPWSGFGWIVGAAVLYSVVLLVAFPDGFWEWMSTFVATFLSVLAAVFLYRHQKNRAHVERMYWMYLVLDADLRTLLTQTDPTKREMKPLSITLPTGRIASAYVSISDDRVPMLEEVAKAGFESWKGAIHYFTLARLVRSYAAVSTRFVELYDASATAGGVGPNTEEALLHAARAVEKSRDLLVTECERMRAALKGWFERYPHFSPWGPEHEIRWPPIGESRCGLPRMALPRRWSGRRGYRPRKSATNNASIHPAAYPSTTTTCRPPDRGAAASVACGRAGCLFDSVFPHGS